MAKGRVRSVTEYMADLGAEDRAMAEALREMIRGSGVGVVEGIKWNAPSYSTSAGDRITFGPRKPGSVSLVLHLGASRKEDPKGPPILDLPLKGVQWKSDIRCVVTFRSLEEVENGRAELVEAIRLWLSLP